MQIGLTPDAVLDMSLDVFRACINGYADHIFDLQVLSVQQGYWAGYYSNSKKPKSVRDIVRSMTRAHQKNEGTMSTPSPEVDVERFLETERRFKERMNQQGGEQIGNNN